jgi:RNA 3'-terminal phosphate cyclase
VLSKLRLPVGTSGCAQQAVGGAACLTLLRGFAEGTYLDKNQVDMTELFMVWHGQGMAALHHITDGLQGQGSMIVSTRRDAGFRHATSFRP